MALGALLGSAELGLLQGSSGLILGDALERSEAVPPTCPALGETEHWAQY
jgi:hypothetical protein